MAFLPAGPARVAPVSDQAIDKLEGGERPAWGDHNEVTARRDRRWTTTPRHVAWPAPSSAPSTAARTSRCLSVRSAFDASRRSSPVRRATAAPAGTERTAYETPSDAPRGETSLSATPTAADSAMAVSAAAKSSARCARRSSMSVTRLAGRRTMGRGRTRLHCRRVQPDAGRRGPCPGLVRRSMRAITVRDDPPSPRLLRLLIATLGGLAFLVGGAARGPAALPITAAEPAEEIPAAEVAAGPRARAARRHRTPHPRPRVASGVRRQVVAAVFAAREPPAWRSTPLRGPPLPSLRRRLVRASRCAAPCAAPCGAVGGCSLG